ncbi:MAG: hypothetical protein QNJ54_00105 [Prochloraceae cyanobacterium]|nr:hypothetical protein [Prochloraceae cyanobacterium]
MGKIVDRLMYSYATARETGQLPFWIILGLTIYVPVEDFILKFVPLPLEIINLIRIVPELFLYCLCLFILSHKFLNRQRLKGTPIDILVIAFFVSSGISIVLNQASIPDSIDNVRTNFRYLSVFYILVNINMSYEQIGTFLKTIRTCGLIQAGISCFQFFLPDNVSRILFARPGTKAYIGSIKPGASFGTFNEPANLSSFLLLTSAVLLVYVYTQPINFIPVGQNLGAVLTFVFGIFASKKRAALLILLLVFFGILFYLKRKKNVAVIIWIAAAVALLFDLTSSILLNISLTEDFDVFSYFTEIFNGSYWRHTANSSRGFLIIRIVRGLISSQSWFGFGPTPEAVQAGIESALNLNLAEQQQLDWVLYVLDDPYWFAVLAYFGIIGIGLYWFMFVRLFQAASFLAKFSSNKEYKVLGISFCYICIIAFIYAFIERIFRLRGFTFYFWVMAGLVINAYNVERALQSKK